MGLPTTRPAADTSAQPDPREASVHATAESGTFRKAPAVRALLLYLWTHRDEALNEYRIATECLGKGPDFDPKLDATVRVHISRLRQKLKEHADAAGPGDTVPQYRVTLPQGGYHMEVVEASVPESVALPSPPDSSRRLAAWAVFGLLLTAGGFLVWENRRLAATQVQPATPLPRFWADLFRNGKPTSVVLPTPVFFEWADSPLKVRDTRINDFERSADSALLQPLIGKFGPPKLMQNYTVVSDTFAAVKLAQYLQARGVTVSFSGTSDFSIDQFGDRNVILIGLSSSSFHIRQLMDRTNFYSKPEEASTVHNRRPARGEAAEYKMVQQSGSRRSVPGVVALLPGSAPNARVLMVASWASSAVISFLTSNPSLDQLDTAWSQAGSPSYFELLIHSDIEGNAVLRAGVVGLREFVPAPRGEK
jgi:hypothetical protein